MSRVPDSDPITRRDPGSTPGRRLEHESGVRSVQDCAPLTDDELVRWWDEVARPGPGLWEEPLHDEPERPAPEPDVERSDAWELEPARDTLVSVYDHSGRPSGERPVQVRVVSAASVSSSERSPLKVGMSKGLAR